MRLLKLLYLPIRYVVGTYSEWPGMYKFANGSWWLKIEKDKEPPKYACEGNTVLYQRVSQNKWGRWQKHEEYRRHYCDMNEYKDVTV